MEELQQCRVQQRNIATTIDKLTHCLPGNVGKHGWCSYLFDIFIFGNTNIYQRYFGTKISLFISLLLSPGDVQQTSRTDEGQKVCYTTVHKLHFTQLNRKWN